MNILIGFTHAFDRVKADLQHSVAQHGCSALRTCVLNDTRASAV